MTKHKILSLAQKAIKNYAQEHYGFGAKYHPDKKELWDALMEAIHMLEELKGGI